MRTGDRRGLIVVGASLAGLRAARTLRERGFTGALTIVGEEPHPPYDRPPLSKRVLTAPDRPPRAELPVPYGLEARWRLGQAAVRLDLAARALTLADGTRLPYDGLVIATGSAARSWPAAKPPPPAGVFTLRSWDDALALRAVLAAGGRLVVIGAGFLGGEIAAAARERGLDVTLVEAAAQPLARAIGTTAGAYVAALHREAGIAVRTGTTVEDFLTRTDGRLAGVRLSDGATVRADTAVLALGGVPSTGWLAGSGLAHDGGVHCDAHLRVLRTDGSVVPDVVAAGDVARVPQPLADGERLALGHWTNAVEQGAAAAATLLAGRDPARAPGPFAAVPSFWSDLHGARIRSVGLPAAADETRVVEHDLAGRRLEISYHRAGRLVGALTIGRTGRLASYRSVLEERLAPVTAAKAPAAT
ncbi:pyridine nucleotide-disulfide oxidoreductase [Streptomyces leeuwenhoekii]|uniref:Pyridine nucleotide-disulfide oxidoreductase n=1 Tax=Streptomyces leeuwenhoekii TaxID=1437453 RepID=A0ABR5HWR2_STRLW|nr:FAD-dependent oxidoreductase [Streptomyces leeuwenhoekii]KMS78172.1 pyridine nucleotide-disulfide oxidoreductase [Streptomyces leeuwenhoekii]